MTTTTNPQNTFLILAMNDTEVRAEKMAVAVFTNDLDAGRSHFFAYRENKFYNPKDEYKPLTSGQRLNDTQKAEYLNLLDEAQIMYGRERAKRLNSGGVVNNSALSALEKSLEAQKVAAAKKDSELEALRAEIEALRANKGPEKVYHEKFGRVVFNLKKNRPVYLSGPAGTGKSELVRQAAESLGLEFYPVSSVSQEYKLTGFLDMKNDYKETQFYKAFKYGGVFFLDEMDACQPEVLVMINSAIANRYFDFPNEFVEAHENFRVIAAGNTRGGGADSTYTGRFQLDGSTLDRYRNITINYSPTIEKAITNDNAEFLAFIWELRRACKETDIQLIVSYRSMARVIEAENDENDLDDLTEIFDECLVKGLLDEDDIIMVSRAMALENKNRYYSAFKKLA